MADRSKTDSGAQTGHPGAVLEFRGVSFSYGKLPVLRNISFHVHEKTVTALTGKNGAGKTTILKLILGLEKPAAGEITLFGKPAGQQRHRIGYVPQQANFDPAFPVPVQEVVRMGRVRPFSRKFTQEDFADKFCVDVRTIRRWVNGGMYDLRQIQQIADFFEIDVFAILS